MDESPLRRPLVRCLTKHEAADYLGVGITLFEALRIPAVRFGRRVVCDRIDLAAGEGVMGDGTDLLPREHPAHPGVRLLIKCSSGSRLPRCVKYAWLRSATPE